MFSKKSTNAINIISGVSGIGIAFGTMALILVLSVFNGLEGLVIGLYDTFNPDLKITPTTGKTFKPSDNLISDLENIDGVFAVSQILEEVAALQYDERNAICKLKGVDKNFNLVSNMDTAIVRGKFNLGGQNAVLGLGVELELGVNVYSDFEQLIVYMPKRTGKVSLNPEKAFKKGGLQPRGTFSIQESFDREYVIAPLKFVQNLLDYSTELSHLEIAIDKNADLENVQNQVKNLLGNNFKIQNRFEQNEFLYKVMQTEKWAVFLILSLILVVASFNIIGSLSMLVIEKKDDIKVLKALGADSSMIRKIFLSEGILLALSGGIIGMVMAFFICLLQKWFGIVKIQGKGLLLESYPVEMQPMDFVLVFLTVATIAFLASFWPAMRAARQVG